MSPDTQNQHHGSRHIDHSRVVRQKQKRERDSKPSDTKNKSAGIACIEDPARTDQHDTEQDDEEQMGQEHLRATQ
jgi:hypothetical protein